MPDFKADIKKQLVKLKLAPTRESEIVEELSQHLEDQYDQSISRGTSEEEARAAAFASLTENDVLTRELKRVERRVADEPLVSGNPSGRNLVADVSQDLRYGIRVLLKNPGFTVAAVVALALAIGANSVIFSVVNAVLLRPLPFKDSQRLVVVWENAAHLGFPKDTPPPGTFLDWQQQNTVFTGMAATALKSFNVLGAGEPERVDGRKVSANLFDLLGVRPVLGRTFSADEDKPGTHVAILSEGLWKRRFGSDPSVIGRGTNLSGEIYTVIGVLPQTVELPSTEAAWHDQLWVPIAFSSEDAANRDSHYLQVFARLKSNVSLKQAQAEMDTIAARLAKQYPEHNARRGVVVVPMHEQIVGDIKPALLVLLGAVGFVLLIACANVANLLLARAAVRQKEIALRLALGANRSRLTRQFLAESILLALIGATVGLGLAMAGLNIIKRYIPDTVSQSAGISIDVDALLFTAGIAILTGVLFGLVPAFQASHCNVNDTLKESGRDAAAGAR
ncbi:MAG: ABC transporter permease, partial [Chthoniobacterales bacterium]